MSDLKNRIATYIALQKLERIEEKYYIPEIEEFHIGFEYEAKRWIIGEQDNVRNPWKIYNDFSEDYGNNDTDTIGCVREDIDSGYIRVKYLSKEDIERELKNKLDFTEIGYEKDNFYEFSFNQGGVEFSGLLTNSDRMFSIYEDKECLFRGEIKNFNELHKLLKQ